MFWAFLLVVLLAAVLVKAGAMSVWVTVLFGALHAVLVGAAFLAVILGVLHWTRGR